MPTDPKRDRRPPKRTGGRIILFANEELRGVLAGTPDYVRWGWVALRLLVADCPYRPVLCVSAGVPFTDKQLAGQLGIPTSRWRETKSHLLANGFIEENEDGIRVPHWKEIPARKRPKVLRPGESPDDLLPLEKEELEKYGSEMASIMNVYNSLTGSHYPFEAPLFVRNYRKLKAQGVEKEDMIRAIRRYVSITSRAPRSIIYRRTPWIPLGGKVYWKLIKKYSGMEVRARPMTTLEMISDLPTADLRVAAREHMRDYSRMLELKMRREGWDDIYDVDWNKMPSCFGYVQRKLDLKERHEQDRE